MILAYKKLTKIAKKYCLILIDEDLFAIKNELKEVAKAQKITIQIVQDNNESQTIEQKPYNKTNKEIVDATCVSKKAIRNNLKKA